jgi:osmoprotectant transport system ATP-binding protein
MHPVIFIKVSFAYDHKRVLNDIDVAFDANQITVILGRSGSGKSTMLQMINGMLIPDTGSVSVFGNKIKYEKIHLLRRSIGYSVQGSGLFPHMTVYENISLLARIARHDPEETKKRIDYLMTFVDLDHEFKSKYPYQLSGGEQQRVGICRAMILNPKIFLLDEAFGALDVATRNEIHIELLNLQKAEPRTIIMVTHDVSEALKLADNILVLDNGIIQQYATPDTLLKNPANEFVQSLISGQK